MPTPKDTLQQTLMECVTASDWAKAIGVLEELSRLEPVNTQYRLRIGDYHLKLNNKAKAIEEYYRAAEAFTQAGLAVKAMAVYKMILRLNPEDPKAHEALHALRPTVSSSWAQSGPPQTAFKESLVLSLFASLTQEQFNEVVERLQSPQLFPPETVIIREGEKGGALYIITRGRVRITTRQEGQDVKVAELGENEFFGELSHLTGKPRIATVTTMMESELLTLQEPDLIKITTRFPAVKDILTEYGLRRMRQTLDRLKE